MVAIYRAAIAIIEMHRNDLLYHEADGCLIEAIAHMQDHIANSMAKTDLLYWMHTSWPWLSSWIYPPDVSEEETHEMWRLQKQKEDGAFAEQAQMLDASADLELSFLELSMCNSVLGR